MPHPLAADTVIRDLHPAAVADDAPEFGAAALVFAAGALVAARWPEDALAEKPVLFRTQRFGSMVRFALRGDLIGAREIHYRFVELMDLLFVDGNPAGVKSMLSVMGLIKNNLRLPLVPTTVATMEKIKKVLAEINKLEDKMLF